MTVFMKTDALGEKKAPSGAECSVPPPPSARCPPSPPHLLLSPECDDNQRNERQSKKRSSSFGALSIVRLTPSPLCRTPSPPRSPQSNPRRRLVRQFILLLVLVLLCCSFLAGYFYRQVLQRRSYSGWCGVVVNDDGRPQNLAQKVEIDSDALYEKIDVPKFGANRPAIFVHDFKQNMTAIVDVVGRRCFLKELDRSTVSPPNNFIEMLNKMQTPYMETPSRIVRETFKVGAPLSKEEMDTLNSFIINRHCMFRPAFHLRKMSETEEMPAGLSRRRRNALRGKKEESVLQFSALTGDSLQVDNILL